MKRALTILFLLSICINATAAWVRAAGNNNVGVYADPASIQRSGNSVKMKSLLNFTTAQTERSIGNKPYLSQSQQHEFDCAHDRYRLLHFSLRAGFMGAGNVVRSGADSGEWQKVQPASIGHALWLLACGKK